MLRMGAEGDWNRRVWTREGEGKGVERSWKRVGRGGEVTWRVGAERLAGGEGSWMAGELKRRGATEKDRKEKLEVRGGEGS